MLACEAFSAAEGPSDGGSSDAGSSDVASETESDAGFNCASARWICEDFERFDGAAYEKGTSNGRFSVMTDGGYHSSSALRIETDPVNDNSNDCAAWIGRAIDGTRWRVSFAFRILKAGAGRFRIAQLTYTSGLPKAYALEVWLNGSADGGGPAVGDYDGVSYAEYPSNEPAFDGAWHEMQMDFDQATKKVTLIIDRSRVALSAIASKFPDGGMSPVVKVGAVIVFTPSTRWDVAIDNVSVDDLP